IVPVVGGSQSPAPTVSPGAPSPGATAGTYEGNKPGVRHHIGDGQFAGHHKSHHFWKKQRNAKYCKPGQGGPGAGGGQGNVPVNNPDIGQQVLGDSCENSQRAPHDGFQVGDRCVSTAFGEVGNADR